MLSAGPKPDSVPGSAAGDEPRQDAGKQLVRVAKMNTRRKTHSIEQLSIPLADAASEGWIARELSDLDGRLAGLSARQVEVRVRRNRSTLGSLRQAGNGDTWRFTVARRLLDESPGDALLLGRILLHRLRRRPVPNQWTLRLAELKQLWSSPESPATSAGISDSKLHQRLVAVAAVAAPALAAEKLPGIHWRASRSRRILGRYLADSHQIQLHAGLDDPRVPDCVLDDLIHHELLHALLGPRRQGGRVVHHHSEFRRLERAWPGHGEAEIWCRRHLRRLLR